MKSGQAITVLFSTANPTTGAAADASSTPTGTLYVNGTADAASVTVTNITTGLYKAAVTLPTLSAGDTVALRIDATVASVAGKAVVWQGLGDTVRLSDVSAYVDTEVAAIKAKTDNLPSDPADASDIAASFSTVNSTLSTIAGYLDTEVAAIKAKTDNLPASPAATGDIPSAAAIADAVWDEATSGHATTGSTGAALTAAGSAGDPWGTALPGAYGSGTAGHILGNRLDAATSTRASQSSVDTVDTVVDAIATYVDTEVAAIKAKTDNLPSDPADASDIAASFSTVNSTLSTIAGYLDTVVAAILEDTGTTIPALIAGLSTGAGSGAYTITVTVTDGTDPLQNATVRLIEGVNNFSAVTDASGEAAFALDAATYSVAVTKDGYSFTPTTRTVTGNEAGTLTNDLEMDAVVLAAISTDARVVTYQSVLYGIARRKGLDPDVVLQTNEAAALTEYLNAGYRFCWRHYDWPEAVTIEQVTAVDAHIPWAGETTYRIEDVLDVTVNHPLTSTNPTPIGYTLGAEGIYITNPTYSAATLYVRYRRQVPQFTHVLWASGSTYAVGDLVYFSTDGDCYRCLAATTAGQSPATHAAKWQRQDLLELLVPAVTQYALSEAMREDGQHATSMITDGTLESLLAHEIDRLVLDQGVVSTIRTRR